jgi:hypothetical protein
MKERKPRRESRTAAQGPIVACKDCINGLVFDKSKQNIFCADNDEAKERGKKHNRDFCCGKGILLSSYNPFPKKKKPARGKAFLQVAHYRMMEIDKSEMDDLVNAMDISEYTITRAFFRLTKERLYNGTSRCLDDSYEDARRGT